MTTDQYTAKRLKVLVIAEAANPEWVSVPLVGWSMASALRTVADVHIVTHIRNREAFLRAGMREGLDFTAIDSEAVAKPLWKIGSFLRMGEGRGWTTLQLFNSLAYPYFEHLVWKQFGPDLRAGKYDIVHRITPLSPVTPSPLVAKCLRAKVPFVVGPLNGGVPWPKGFDSERRREGEWLSYLRSAYRYIPGTRSIWKSSAILAGSRRVLTDVPARHQERCILLPENGIDPRRFSREARRQEGPLRACFIGRLVPLKGVDMLIEAAKPLLKDGQMVLDLIGDGPMMDSLKATVAQEGLEAAVTFHGWLEHERIQDIASECSLLAFPSFREFGGGVVLEAMAMGMVPLVVDYGGPAELVNEETGFKVPLGTRAEITAGFRKALTALAADPAQLDEKGRRARARINEVFTWERKAEQMLAVYDWVLGKTGQKPRFFE